MEGTIELPDTIAQQRQQQWQGLPHWVLEGLALKGYGVPFYTLADLEHDRETSQHLRQ